MHQMRKKSREMDATFAHEVFTKAPYVTVSMVDPDGMPYAVPLSLAAANEKTFYFHCAKEGFKLDCIRLNPHVSISAVTKSSPTIGPKDNSFTLEFKSAIGYGIAQQVTDEAEKIEAMRIICQRFLPHHMDAFQAAIERSIAHTAVVKITLTEAPKGKRKEYDTEGNEIKNHNTI